MVLMELGEYPFSEHYGWLQDRYGLSWQLQYSGDANAQPKITPVIMFVGKAYGKAEEAIHFWIDVFRDGKVLSLQHFGKNEGPDQEGALKYGSFSLFGQEFAAMESAYDHAFFFNEAISFLVNCETQEEIDGYWKKLSAVPESEQCGWLKDKYGVSWQIVPASLGDMLTGDDRARINRVTQAFLPMKKLDLATLQKAYEGN